MMGGQQVRVLIVDDHEMFAKALELWLYGRDGIEVVGIAHDGAGAVEQAVRLGADVVLMDLNLPKLDGLEATRRLLELNPRVRVIALTGRTEEVDKAAAGRAGMVDYLVKDGVPEKVLRAIHRAVADSPVQSKIPRRG